MVDKVGKRYAEAIYDIAQEEKKVKEIHNLLEELRELYYSNSEFKDFISHPLIKLDDKLKLVEKIVQEQDEIERNIALYLVTKGRIPDIKEIQEEYKILYYSANNILDVKSTFAKEPSELQKRNLIEKLEKKTSKKINLQVEIDNSIIGGAIIKIGDKIIDGSIKTQIQNMKG